MDTTAGCNTDTTVVTHTTAVTRILQLTQHRYYSCNTDATAGTTRMSTSVHDIFLSSL